MTEILSFYSVAQSQGKRTISLAYADLLAQNEHSVLYVELDYKRSSVAIATQISDDEKNANLFFQNTALRNSFDVTPFVLTKDHLIKNSDRAKRKIHSTLHNKIEYLIFPLGFGEDGFPTLIKEDENEKEAEEYISKLIYSLRSTKYDYVVLNLPIELYSIFGIEVLNNSDHILNVVTPSATRLYENQRMKDFLLNSLPDLKNKWFTIVNMASREVSDREYYELVSDEPVMIYFDPDRQQEELSFQLGSKEIQHRLEELASRMGIEIEMSSKKKSVFSRR
ncbi:hypothetical protein [Bacillus safensis]|uniref:hypothetical protein n=1 Tax=Bacillus safensis TaxID=561879 RepID=UPI002E22011D|nr:hypothetical protein [Bacillus safensis]